jgi:S1-C subfamily serine protease
MLIPALGLKAASRETGGAEIVEVAPGSTAELAGLHVGDVINVADGKPIRAALEAVSY